MSTVARTLRGHLSPAAFDALHLTVEWSAVWDDVPWSRDPVCRLSVLVQTLLRLGGSWQDLVDLIALRDDFLDEFLNEWHASTVWVVAIDHYRLDLGATP